MADQGCRRFAAYSGDTDHRYDTAGLGRSVGFGSRPAVVVVDLHVAFTDPSYPLGADLDDVVRVNADLLAVAHANSVPVFLTRTGYQDPDEEIWPWTLKAPGLRSLHTYGPGFEIDPRLGTAPTDRVLTKKFNSAFFGTDLADDLSSLGVDTLIVTGATTSGCVRATVVDSAQNRLRTVVPLEAVGDRCAGPHHSSLYDMNAKWADVLPVGTVKDWLAEHAKSRTSASVDRT